MELLGFRKEANVWLHSKEILIRFKLFCTTKLLEKKQKIKQKQNNWSDLATHCTYDPIISSRSGSVVIHLVSTLTESPSGC